MMEIQRFVLFIVFSFSMLLLWEAWQKDHQAPATQTTANSALPADKSTAPVPSGGISSPGPSTANVAGVVPGPQAASSSHETIRVETDLFKADIDTLGGSITSLELLEHTHPEDQQKNVLLLGSQHHYELQSGLVGESLPNHRTAYTAASRQYSLGQDQQTLQVPLEASAGNVKVRKTISFHRGSYLIDVEEAITNSGSAPVAAHSYIQVTRDSKAPDGSRAMASTYTGPAVFTDQDKFHKVTFKDLDDKPYSKTADNGWIGMVQHYFVVAMVPSEKQPREMYARKLGDENYATGIITPVAPVAPGATTTSMMSVYAGPQEQDKLKTIAPGLNLVVDYGWLTVIAAPLFWILQFFHGWLGNWGLAIILLTVLIKLVFFPLSATSYRSMAKMKQVTPRLTKIREQYADDRMKQNQAMMELYKEEKINPLGGCLPIVVQIPVFIALYWVLLASVELREAPFYGWIHDLSSADPYYILPALMMVSMIVQTRMSPMPPDPVQAKVMQIMPFVFGAMFFVFPAGLVLYWLVNNVLSIWQQWFITRKLSQPQTTAARS